jgi:ubiquinone/menaquinone biosynthesis C-methylase UbiE
MIFLPGTDKQLQHLSSKTDFEGKKILLIGGGCEEIIKTISQQKPDSFGVIVDDENSLIEYRLKLKKDNKIKIAFMDFAATDFPDENFDLVYVQGTVSRDDRNIIANEVFRILKNNGIYSVGEIVKLKKDAPVFMKDIWETGNISPIFIDDLENFYKQNNFDLINSEDISATLKDFYFSAEKRIKNAEKDDLFSSEDKKLLKRFKHEVNAFNKLGGDKVMGFVSLILRKTV